MSVGEARVEHRASVAPGESTFVQLSVTGAAELSGLKTQPAAHNSPADPGFVYKLSPQVDLYPWMWAELQAAPSAFTVAPAGRQRKPVLPGHPAEWVWTLAPDQGRGRQDLTVHIGAIIRQADAPADLEVETAESVAIAIDIAPAPAGPAPAELARRNDNIASITLVILISLACVAFLVLAWRRQERA